MAGSKPVPGRATPASQPATAAGPGKRLDPEALGAHLGSLLRMARGLCWSSESAEDLVQETLARVLARPRLLRGEDELAYLRQALRNTIVTSRRTADRRPRVVASLEGLDVANCQVMPAPDEAMIAAQVFPAIARLPKAFRLTLLAIDVAGFTYGEAAQALGAHETTIATRLYRARRRVARDLDPVRFAAA